MEEEADGNVGELEISTECGEQQHEMMTVHLTARQNGQGQQQM